MGIPCSEDPCCVLTREQNKIINHPGGPGDRSELLDLLEVDDLRVSYFHSRNIHLFSDCTRVESLGQG